MLYTKTLLSRYISIFTDPQEFSQLLTDRVCEVEELSIRKIPNEVVVGFVKDVQNHPDADKLVICQLDCGHAGNYQICTGATNIKTGQYVPVAIPGCHLPAINLTIEPRKMRGQDSNGMICSKNELGMGLDAGKHRIWVIQGEGLRTELGNEDSPYAGDINTLTSKDCGKPLHDIFPWIEGWIIDVENKTITHRPDLFGHFGLAVETRTMIPEDITFSRLPEVIEQMQESKIMEVMTHSTSSDIAVHIQSDACRCYALMSYNDITVKPSDFFMKLTLSDIGIQSTSNWVDFSNIFMQTTGQPIHFFDADTISGSITVRQAHEGELFVDLFDHEHTLTENDLVICDDEGVIALAGLVGGKRTGITQQTKNIAVEIANFDPVMIRKTALRLGMRTEAQTRFEKNINPLFTLACVQLFQDEVAYFASSLGTATFAGLQRELSNQDTPLHHRIPYTTNAIRSQVIGGEPSEEGTQHIITILEGLGCVVGKESVVTPAWRGPEDLTGQHDLIEEVARHIGFNTIPERELRFPIQFVSPSDRVQLVKHVESLLADTYAMDQIQTYSWMHDKRLQYVETPAYTLANSIDSERMTMRPTMLWSMIEILEKNQGAFESMNIFDCGRCWDEHGKEHQMVGIVSVQQHTAREDHPQHRIKAACEDIVQAVNVRGKFETQKTSHDYAHPIQQATLSVNTTQYGRMLTLHPGWMEMHGITTKGSVVFAELSLTTLLELQTSKKPKKTLSSLQDHQIWRDVAFLVERDSAYGRITDAIKQVREVEHVEVFDLFAGKGMDENQKSIALRYKTTFSQTPTTQQINEILEKVIKAGEKAGGVLRGKN